MSSVEFQASRPLLFPENGVTAARLRAAIFARRPRLAIISTYSELCGIAAYTRHLERQLAEVFDIRVFDLNQYLLRAAHRRVRRFGDRHIHEICRELKDFDAVNLQLEHGTLGRTAREIFRRFGWIVRAAPQLSVTFHTMFDPAPFDYARWFRAISRFNFTEAAVMRAEYYRNHLLSAGIARRLRRAQRFKPVSIIVHTRRDLWHMKYVHALHHVYDHPLSFLSDNEAANIRLTAGRRRFPILDAVPDDAKLVGVFGFIGRYKGFDTVIRALHHLPRDHHLVIVGGVHPNEIKPHQTIDPNVTSLFEAGFIDTNVAERIRAVPSPGTPTVSVAVDSSMRDLLIHHPKDLSDRIHFLGATSDADFVTGMAICDAVVFPYLEVGQSSSGPISQALELGCRVIASRTHTFLQLGKYHSEMIEYFDIGNHLELAARLLARPQYDIRARRLDFNVETNRAVYLAANGCKPRHTQPGRVAETVETDTPEESRR
jgi:glycosyltransferase involved in cell wall biosynthesis